MKMLFYLEIKKWGCTLRFKLSDSILVGWYFVTMYSTQIKFNFHFRQISKLFAVITKFFPQRKKSASPRHMKTLVEIKLELSHRGKKKEFVFFPSFISTKILNHRKS